MTRLQKQHLSPASSFIEISWSFVQGRDSHATRICYEYAKFLLPQIAEPMCVSSPKSIPKGKREKGSFVM